MPLHSKEIEATATKKTKVEFAESKKKGLATVPGSWVDQSLKVELEKKKTHYETQPYFSPADFPNATARLT